MRPKKPFDVSESFAERMSPTVSTPMYRELVGVLEKYVSPMLLHATLRNALEQQGQTPVTFSTAMLDHVLADALVGIRLFCDPARMPDLEADLEALRKRIALRGEP